VVRAADGVVLAGSSGTTVMRTARRRVEAILGKVETGADLALRFVSRQGYHGEWRAELHAVPEGTRVVVTERVVLEGVITRIVSHLVFDPAQFSRAYLEDLAARLESGA